MRDLVLLAVIAAAVGSCVRPAGPAAPAGGAGVSPDGRSAVLYPPPGALTDAGRLTVIAIVPAAAPPTVLVDGVPVNARRMAFSRQFIEEARLFPTSRPAVVHPLDSPLLNDKTGNVLLVAEAVLGGDRHLIDVHGARGVVKRARGNPHPAGAYREHGTAKGKPPVTDCRWCHDMDTSGPAEALGVAQPPGACQKCHNDDELDLAHKHKMDSLSRCHLCHDPHGSSRPHLLINDREKLCALCHEAGHYKK